jgi:hypothetical protein
MKWTQPFSLIFTSFLPIFSKSMQSFPISYRLTCVEKRSKFCLEIIRNFDLDFASWNRNYSPIFLFVQWAFEFGIEILKFRCRSCNLCVQNRKFKVEVAKLLSSPKVIILLIVLANRIVQYCTLICNFCGSYNVYVIF